MKAGLIGSGHVAHAFGAAYQAVHGWSGQWNRRGEEVIPGVPIERAFSDWNVAFLAVADDALEALSRELPRSVWRIHFSGAKPLEAVVEEGERGAVLWPVCSVRKEYAPDWSEVHWAVEATDDEVFNWANQILCPFGGTVHRMTSEARIKAHAAAVFAANFTNLMLAEALDLASDTGLPWDALLELVRGVVERCADPNATLHLTGPAARGDVATLAAHESVLAPNPELQRIYRSLSDRIAQRLHSERQ